MGGNTYQTLGRTVYPDMNLLEEMSYVEGRLRRAGVGDVAEVVLAMIKVREAGKLASQLGLNRHTWGNISIRVGGLVVITPSGVSKSSLSLTDIVVVTDGGEKVYGHLPPSSELPMHLSIYGARRDANAVVHTHSPRASAFSLAGKRIPARLSEAELFVGREIPVVKYHPPGSKELGDAVAKALGTCKCNAVLLERHGAVSVGPTIEAALSAAVAVEDAATTMLLERLLGG